MAGETAIYMEVDLLPSEEQKGKVHPAQKGFPWHLVAVFLGIMCFLLLLAIVILGYLYFQRTSESTIQNMEDAKKKNASCTQGVDYPSMVPPATKITCSPCRGKWSCCGEKCYYFSKEEKTWDDSRKSCQDMNSSLTEIADNDEQEFIQSQINYNHWIGLRRKGALHPWRWQNGSEPSKTLNFQQMPRKPGKPDTNCGYLKPTAITTYDCNKPLYYICERTFTCLANKNNY